MKELVGILDKVSNNVSLSRNAAYFKELNEQIFKIPKRRSMFHEKKYLILVNLIGFSLH